MDATADPPRERNAAATKRSILDQARRQFAQHGYRATTVKGIADAAGVSPNLITRYFGGKEGLFLAAAQVEIAVNDVYDGPLAGLGDRLAASIVQRWFGQQGEDPLLVLLRAAGERPEAAAALAGFLDTHSLAPLRRYLRACGLPDAEADARAAAIDTFLIGVSTRWRVLRPDLGDPGALRGWLATAIQRLADGGFSG
jgi:AcrR family transcriptional regulator